MPKDCIKVHFFVLLFIGIEKDMTFHMIYNMLLYLKNFLIHFLICMHIYNSRVSSVIVSIFDWLSTLCSPSPKGNCRDHFGQDSRNLIQ